MCVLFLNLQQKLQHVLEEKGEPVSVGLLWDE